MYGLQVLEHEHIYLDALPSAHMYERSYMHRDVVTHVLTAQEQDFVITGSADGHLKFWKKKGEGIEFAKHFRAHMEAVAGLFCHATLHSSWDITGLLEECLVASLLAAQLSMCVPGMGLSLSSLHSRLSPFWGCPYTEDFLAMRGIESAQLPATSSALPQHGCLDWVWTHFTSWPSAVQGSVSAPMAPCLSAFLETNR